MPSTPALRAAVEIHNLLDELQDATIEQIAEIIDLETGLPDLLTLITVTCGQESLMLC